MAGTLFVVATPIGHLEDISLRALRVLREVAVVAAEDTRRTGNLLRHFEIPTRLISLHHHNEGQKTGEVLSRLGRGESVALVSDAGTPGISDPGAGLVRNARAAGFRVEPIPGPSAVAAAISVAGLEGTGFAFLGFPPIKAKDRNMWFDDLAELHRQRAVVFFEAPHRVRQTIEKLANYVKSPILVLRELTKVHEEVLEGPPLDVLSAVKSPMGEYTVVVPMTTGEDAAAVEVTDERLREEFGEITKIGTARSPREAARQVAERFGVSTRRVYEATRNDNPA
jgi:16S rRNA (cytidine1402-2'-O)-methyltransferase